MRYLSRIVSRSFVCSSALLCRFHHHSLPPSRLAHDRRDLGARVSRSQSRKVVVVESLCKSDGVEGNLDRVEDFWKRWHVVDERVT